MFADSCGPFIYTDTSRVLLKFCLNVHVHINTHTHTYLLNDDEINSKSKSFNLDSKPRKLNSTLNSQKKGV